MYNFPPHPTVEFLHCLGIYQQPRSPTIFPSHILDHFFLRTASWTRTRSDLLYRLNQRFSPSISFFVTFLFLISCDRLSWLLIAREFVIKFLIYHFATISSFLQYSRNKFVTIKRLDEAGTKASACTYISSIRLCLRIKQSINTIISRNIKSISVHPV